MQINETDIESQKIRKCVNNQEIGNSDHNNECNNNVRQGRKKLKHPKLWKQTIRKRRRQSAEEYMEVTGKLQRARELRIKKDCSGCKYHCSKKLLRENQKEILDFFWSLNDFNKNVFYAQTTSKVLKARQRTNSEQSRRQFT
jgi:hypothetical protein